MVRRSSTSKPSRREPSRRGGLVGGRVGNGVSGWPRKPDVLELGSPLFSDLAVGAAPSFTRVREFRGWGRRVHAPLDLESASHGVRSRPELNLRSGVDQPVMTASSAFLHQTATRARQPVAA